MKKNLIAVICYAFMSLHLFSQTKIGSFKNSLKTNLSNIKDVMTLVNKESNDITFFLADAKNVYVYRLNEQFEITNKLISESKKRKFKVLLGSAIDRENYHIFLSNKQKNKFICINFDLKREKTTSHEFVISKNETLIQTISHQNNFYILTGNKYGGIFLYSFNKLGQPVKKAVNNHYNPLVLNKKSKLVKITELLAKSHETSVLKKFKKDIPNAIESVSSNKKMFVRNNKVILTLDHYKKLTQILTIDLAKKELTSYKTYEKPLANEKSSRKKTNSFLYEDKIFLIAGDKERLLMHVLEYPSGNFIKDFAILKDEKIDFKNSPIIQKGGDYNNHREFEKTKKFLRKITSEFIGVSVIKNKGDYQLTLGGYIQRKANAAFGMMGAMGAMPGLPIASFGNATVFFNPVMLAYNSYANTKSTRIECLFNDKFEHIAGKKAPENVFGKIHKTEIQNKAASTIFKYKDYFIKGDYNSLNKIYTLTKFTY